MTAVLLDPYIVDVLMPDLVGHDRQPSAFLVYLHLWRRTHGERQRSVQVALGDLAEATGLSKRGIQDALSWLAKRQLIVGERRGATAIASFTVLEPWRR